MWQPMHGKGLAQYRRKGDGDAWRGRQGRADYSRPRARAGQSHHHGQGGRRCGRSDQRLRACIQILQMRIINSSSQRRCEQGHARRPPCTLSRRPNRVCRNFSPAHSDRSARHDSALSRVQILIQPESGPSQSRPVHACDRIRRVTARESPRPGRPRSWARCIPGWAGGGHQG